MFLININSLFLASFQFERSEKFIMFYLTEGNRGTNLVPDPEIIVSEQ